MLWPCASLHQWRGVSPLMERLIPTRPIVDSETIPKSPRWWFALLMCNSGGRDMSIEVTRLEH